MEEGEDKTEKERIEAEDGIREEEAGANSIKERVRFNNSHVYPKNISLNSVRHLIEKDELIDRAFSTRYRQSLP